MSEKVEDLQAALAQLATNVKRENETLFSEVFAAMKYPSFRQKVVVLLAEHQEQMRRQRSPYKDSVVLRFNAEDVASGETREVKVQGDFGDVPLFKLHKIWLTDDGGKWWLHNILTDACKHRSDDQKYFCTVHGNDYGTAYKGGLCRQFPPRSGGCLFESTPPLSSGTTMDTCDPRSIVLVIENKGTETMTFKAMLLGVKPRTAR